MHEVFGGTEEATVTVMVMKNIGPSTTSGAGQESGEKMVIDNDGFWDGIRNVVMERYQGERDKEEVFAALKKGFAEKFGSA